MMTTKELEELIEGQAETQNLDFKAAMDWDVKSFAKDILAMSNVRDGGSIVIGVQEEGHAFVGTGISDSQMKTYKIDHMKDQLLRYADPAADIRVMFPMDSTGRTYVVIKVLPFREVPLISKSEIPGELKANAIYYRNTNMATQSAAVSNAHDLREIIETATLKMMQRRKEAGFTAIKSTGQALDEELNDLPGDGVLPLIKSKGYWEIRFQPLSPGNIESVKKCLEIVERSRISLNWTFPWLPRHLNEKERMYPGEHYYQVESDNGTRKEFWRLYKSEQFIDFKGLIEDWYGEGQGYESLAEKHPSGTTLTFYTSVLLLLSETFAFLSRLGENGLYKDGVEVNCRLYGIKDRQLRIDDRNSRYQFGQPKITIAPKLMLNGSYAIQDVIENNVELANAMILKVLDAFGFNPSKESIRAEQNRYLSGQA